MPIMTLPQLLTFSASWLVPHPAQPTTRTPKLATRLTFIDHQAAHLMSAPPATIIGVQEGNAWRRNGERIATGGVHRVEGLLCLRLGDAAEPPPGPPAPMQQLLDPHRSLEQDYNKSFYWIKLAAEQGRAEALLGLGNIYYYGQGVPKDNKEAYKWFKLAAEQGITEAREVVAVLERLMKPEDLSEAQMMADEWAGKHIK